MYKERSGNGVSTRPGSVLAVQAVLWECKQICNKEGSVSGSDGHVMAAKAVFWLCKELSSKAGLVLAVLAVLCHCRQATSCLRSVLAVHGVPWW